ncbi:hypothetical protein WN990_19335 [Kitasatospora purpeofusca]|nr:hypothetical protein OG715_02685 [Kitasatospora purpeofusca]WSR38176.1 hypothetical protein OG196_03265 [Kitasatospora purpeofusca]
MTARKLVPLGTDSSGTPWRRQASASSGGTVPWVPSPASSAAASALRRALAKRRAVASLGAGRVSSGRHHTRPVSTISPALR